MRSMLKSGLDRLLLVAGASLVAATLIVVVTTDDSGSGASAGGDPSVAMTDNVAIKDFKFLPSEIAVPVGAKITWTNSDTAPHTATSGTGSSADGTFDTKKIERDGSVSVTVSKPGTFAYYCRFHSFMRGTVTIR